MDAETDLPTELKPIVGDCYFELNRTALALMQKRDRKTVQAFFRLAVTEVLKSNYFDEYTEFDCDDGLRVEVPLANEPQFDVPPIRNLYAAWTRSQGDGCATPTVVETREGTQ